MNIDKLIEEANKIIKLKQLMDEVYLGNPDGHLRIAIMACVHDAYEQGKRSAEITIKNKLKKLISKDSIDREEEAQTDVNKPYEELNYNEENLNNLQKEFDMKLKQYAIWKNKKEGDCKEFVDGKSIWATVERYAIEMCKKQIYFCALEADDDNWLAVMGSQIVTKDENLYNTGGLSSEEKP